MTTKGASGGKGSAAGTVVDFASQYAKVVRYEQRRKQGPRASYSGRGGAAGARGRGDAGGPAGAGAGAQQQQQVVELRDVRKEVASLGASGLDKKSAKQWLSSVYESQGLKQSLGKRPRINARIGLGIAKKKVERENKARELARETGMLVRKKKPKVSAGAGSKKKKLKKNSRR